MKPAADSPPTLFFDADDTLWENAVFFRDARRRWRELAGERGHDPERARRRLREVEDAGLARREFGSDRLRRNMVSVLCELEDHAEPTADIQRACHQLADSIRHHPIRYYPDVERVLRAVGTRFRIVMVTMGDTEEQRGKIARAEIAPLFDAIEIAADKHVDLYRDLHARHGSERPSWMIGNSATKDIMPAQEAGLVTVLFRNGAPLPPYFEGAGPKPDHQIEAFAELEALLPE